MNARCPKCEKTFSIPDIYIGRQVKCLECDYLFLASSKNITDETSDSSGTGISGQTILIEKTAKKWKGWQLIGILFIIAGMAFMLIGLYKNDRLATGFGVLVFLLSLLIYFTARFGAWWHHG